MGKKTSHSLCFPLLSPQGAVTQGSGTSHDFRFSLSCFLRFLSTIVLSLVMGTDTQIWANQRARVWYTSMGEISSRVRYLQARTGTGTISCVCVCVKVSSRVHHVYRPSAFTLAKPTTALWERAWGTARLSIELHAITIDDSSERGWDLGVQMLAVCSAAAGIQLTRAKNRRAEIPISLSLVITLHKIWIKRNFNLTALLWQCVQDKHTPLLRRENKLAARK